MSAAKRRNLLCADAEKKADSSRVPRFEMTGG